jgi:type III pantothenate kinase
MYLADAPLANYGDVMLLAVDVAEAETHVGVFPIGSRTAQAHQRFANSSQPTWEKLGSTLESLLARGDIGPDRIDCSIVCSAVPRLSREWRVVARVRLGHMMLDAGQLMRSERRRMFHGGDDIDPHRLANVIAVRDRVRSACVITDFGATVTFDAVAASGAYLGGLAIPRAETALDALCERAPLLSRVRLTAPRSPIGSSTVDALRSGLVYGFAGQVEAIIRRLRDELGGRVRVIATGARSAAATHSIREDVDEVDELLTLDGLRLAAERH